MDCYNCGGSGKLERLGRCYTCQGHGTINPTRAEYLLETYWPERAQSGKDSVQVCKFNTDQLQKVLDEEEERSNVGLTETTLLDSVISSMSKFIKTKHRRNGDRIEGWLEQLQEFRQTLGD